MFVELLKTKIGEKNLHNCDVMIKDIHDSRRLDTFKARAIKTVIVSKHFWPKLNMEAFTLHPKIQEYCAEYEKVYEKSKASRKLCWLTTCGVIDIEFKITEPHNVSVSPPHATVLFHFLEKSKSTPLES
jgi:anaphase-promoting complex subunit 2